jgi:hypothetical protein
MAVKVEIAAAATARATIRFMGTPLSAWQNLDGLWVAVYARATATQAICR